MALVSSSSRSGSGSCGWLQHFNDSLSGEPNASAALNGDTGFVASGELSADQTNDQDSTPSIIGNLI